MNELYIDGKFVGNFSHMEVTKYDEANDLLDPGLIIAAPKMKVDIILIDEAHEGVWKLYHSMVSSPPKDNPGGRPKILDKIKHILEVQVNYPCKSNHPSCGCGDEVCEDCLVNKRAPLEKVVIHLNDECGWTREDIADWLDLMHQQGIIDITLESPNQDKA